ncbi:MAG: hypothetical protein IKN65_05145 [Clostridia bacterium]|nr:hypothetical protein [Clostridia bacterium]
MICYDYEHTRRNTFSVEAFVKCHFSFEMDSEYDVETMSYKVKVTPLWKAAELIDTESEEFKLLTEYALSTL